nr:MAG TPA: hypothetical protein [Caudoviricetes sp.]
MVDSYSSRSISSAKVWGDFNVCKLNIYHNKPLILW